MEGLYLGPGSGPGMEQVCLWEPGLGAIKHYRHVLVPPALVQKHALRINMSSVIGVRCISVVNMRSLLRVPR